jgi:hypothetical protein
MHYVYGKMPEFVSVACVFIDKEIAVNDWIVVEWLIIAGLCEMEGNN